MNTRRGAFARECIFRVNIRGTFRRPNITHSSKGNIARCRAIPMKFRLTPAMKISPRRRCVQGVHIKSVPNFKSRNFHVFVRVPSANACLTLVKHRVSAMFGTASIKIFAPPLSRNFIMELRKFPAYAPSRRSGHSQFE